MGIVSFLPNKGYFQGTMLRMWEIKIFCDIRVLKCLHDTGLSDFAFFQVDMCISPKLLQNVFLKHSEFSVEIYSM